MATALHPTTITSTSSIESHSLGLAPTTLPLKSPWHSPIPYLFGGLAAMLGLIAFALLILACSYWRLSSSDDENQQNDDDLEKGEGVSKIKGPLVYEEKIVVIMAGDDKPTFLANPVQIYLNPTSIHQQAIGNSDDKLGAQDESTTTNTTTTTATSVVDDKPKDDENVQQQQS